jgi:16S rRNA (cytosine967-C5)-methyltransferase
VTARSIALVALRRIEEGAYANLLLPSLLGSSGLDDRDRHLVTNLVYGTTRMRRACDHLVRPHLRREPEPAVLDALHLGAYQLAFLGTPPHAAVSATVDLVDPRARGFVNAILRRVAADVAEGPRWPSAGVALSYPDWIVDEMTTALGRKDALRALEQMNEPATVTEREDGYTQDKASQWVAAAVGAAPGERILDLCAAPGGKATAMATAGADVVAVDNKLSRARLVAGNIDRVRSRLAAVAVADGRHAPFPPESFDKVLVDAPCSGLGVLRRRPDARWRITPEDVGDLARLQHQLLDAAIALTRPGGTVVYSVCTLSIAETVGVDRPGLEALEPPPAPFRPAGRGALLLPQSAGTDGMYLLRLRTPLRST